jgi:hypothetical protein
MRGHVEAEHGAIRGHAIQHAPGVSSGGGRAQGPSLRHVEYDLSRRDRSAPSYFTAPATSTLTSSAASKRSATSFQFQQFQIASKNSVLRFWYWR